jgi:predicted DsbA family dithiol-disulfide isomerase
MDIEVFSDCVCPWCFIGCVRLSRVVASETAPTTVHYRPFFLAADTPEEGVVVADMLRQKYGVDPQQAWDRAQAAARESGLTLDLSRQKRQYPTVRAHTLLRHAAGRGTQPALARSLFEANFTDALNINDPSVLSSVGERHGFGADEVVRLVSDPRELELTRQEAQAALAGGVRGVPFFVFDGRIAVSGAQRESLLSEAAKRARETQRPAAILP